MAAGVNAHLTWPPQGVAAASGVTVSIRMAWRGMATAALPLYGALSAVFMRKNKHGAARMSWRIGAIMAAAAIGSSENHQKNVAAA